MKKYLSLAVSALCMILAVSAAQASVIYTDYGTGFVPALEDLGSMQRGYASFHETGNNAFRLMYIHKDRRGREYFRTSGMYFNGIIGTEKPKTNGPGTYAYASKLDAGVLLGSENQDWLQQESVVTFYSKSNYDDGLLETEWMNLAQEERGYMGFSFSKDGEIRFGWAELSFNDDGLFTLYGYAFETEPGKAILTGDTGYRDPVPEPATMVLFGLGIIGLAGVGRRENRSDDKKVLKSKIPF